MEYHASLFLSQPNSNSAHFSVLLFYEHCANPRILAYSSLEDNRGGYFFAFPHIVQIVGGNGPADAGNDVLPGMAHLHFVDQIRFREDRAACPIAVGCSERRQVAP